MHAFSERDRSVCNLSEAKHDKKSRACTRTYPDENKAPTHAKAPTQALAPTPVQAPTQARAPKHTQAPTRCRKQQYLRALASKSAHTLGSKNAHASASTHRSVSTHTKTQASAKTPRKRKHAHHDNRVPATRGLCTGPRSELWQPTYPKPGTTTSPTATTKYTRRKNTTRYIPPTPH